MLLTGLIFVCLVAGCAGTIEVKPVSFKPPNQYRTHFEVAGLSIAFLPILDEESSRAQFNVDFRRADVIPIRIIAWNRGEKEFLIDAKQIFGVTSAGDFYQSYGLDESTRVIRRSELGNQLATQAAVGALAGAVIGAGIGAGMGVAAGGSGDASRGARAGALIGGTTGAAQGVSAGADHIEQQVRREMRRADWGSQTIFRGETKTGYVFLPRADFQEIAFNIYDLIDRKPISAAVSFSNR
jgi:hypothetical protein